VGDLKENFKTEKHHLLARITELEKENPAYLGRWCVVVPHGLWNELIQEAHNGCFAGHLSEKKVYNRLRQYTWWQCTRADIQHHCQVCLVCV